MTTRNKPSAKPGQQLAALTIGFNTYLMPTDKAMKVLQLMQESFECERDLARKSVDWCYQLRSRPRLELTIVTAEQVRAASSEGQQPADRLLIGGEAQWL